MLWTKMQLKRKLTNWVGIDTEVQQTGHELVHSSLLDSSWCLTQALNSSINDMAL